MRRIIITGGPSSGKTSIINGLSKSGFEVSHEKARLVIKEQLEINLETELVPWKNVLKFSEAVVKEILADAHFRQNDVVFFDRGVPDVLGYLNHAGLNYTPEYFLDSAKYMSYSKEVFFLPSWEAIYENDAERKESYEDAKLISERIREAYENCGCGFEIIEVPKKSIADRIRFILSAINKG